VGLLEDHRRTASPPSARSTPRPAAWPIPPTRRRGPRSTRRCPRLRVDVFGGSGEDALTVDRKFLGSVTMKLPTRLMFLTNELPRMHDASAALAGRFVVLRLTRSFYGQEDIALTAKLVEELPGILLWATEGLNRLRAAGISCSRGRLGSNPGDGRPRVACPCLRARLLPSRPRPSRLGG